MSYNVIEIGFYNEVGVNCGEGCGRRGICKERSKERHVERNKEKEVMWRETMEERDVERKKVKEV